MTFERTIILLCLFIATITAVNLSINILNITGAFLSKNTQIAKLSAEKIDNLTMQDNVLLHQILQNQLNNTR